MLSSHVFDVPNVLRSLQRKEDDLIMPPSMLAKHLAPAFTLAIVWGWHSSTSLLLMYTRSWRPKPLLLKTLGSKRHSTGRSSQRLLKRTIYRPAVSRLCVSFWFGINVTEQIREGALLLLWSTTKAPSVSSSSCRCFFNHGGFETTLFPNTSLCSETSDRFIVNHTLKDFLFLYFHRHYENPSRQLEPWISGQVGEDIMGSRYSGAKVLLGRTNNCFFPLPRSFHRNLFPPAAPSSAYSTAYPLPQTNHISIYECILTHLSDIWWSLMTVFGPSSGHSNFAKISGIQSGQRNVVSRQATTQLDRLDHLILDIMLLRTLSSGRCRPKRPHSMCLILRLCHLRIGNVPRAFLVANHGPRRPFSKRSCLVNEVKHFFTPLLKAYRSYIQPKQPPNYVPRIQKPANLQGFNIR